jgi:hypothetical protein
MSEYHDIVPIVITVNDVLKAAKDSGMAHNSGAGGEFLMVGTEAQLIAMGRRLRYEPPVFINYFVLRALSEEEQIDYNKLCTAVRHAVGARSETEVEYANRRARENDERAAELQRNGHAG